MYRGRPIIRAYPFIKIEMHYYKDRPKYIQMNATRYHFTTNLPHLLLKDITCNLPCLLQADYEKYSRNRKLVIEEVPPNYTRILS